MRRLLVIFGALVLMAGSAFWVFSADSRPAQAPAAAPKVAEIGKLAPDFALKTVSGETMTLSALRGKLVVVNFWATWCPPCKAEMPSMEALYNLFSRDEFAMLAVNVEEDGAAGVKRFLEKNPHTFPVLLDPEAKAQEAFGVYRFPESFIIDKDGVVVDKVVGAIDWVQPATVDYFKSLIAK